MAKLCPIHVKVMAKKLLFYGQVIAWLSAKAWSSLDHVMQVIAKSFSQYQSRSWPINGKISLSHDHVMDKSWPGHGQVIEKLWPSHSQAVYPSHGQANAQFVIIVLSHIRNRLVKLSHKEVKAKVWTNHCLTTHLSQGQVMSKLWPIQVRIVAKSGPNYLTKSWSILDHVMEKS